MLARVKATGKIVDVSMESDNSTDFRKASFRTKDGVFYRYDEIELISNKIKAIVTNCGSHDYASELDELLVTPSIEIAHALVEKYKKEEEK